MTFEFLAYLYLKKMPHNITTNSGINESGHQRLGKGGGTAFIVVYLPAYTSVVCVIQNTTPMTSAAKTLTPYAFKQVNLA